MNRYAVLKLYLGIRLTALTRLHEDIEAYFVKGSRKLNEEWAQLKLAESRPEGLEGHYEDLHDGFAGVRNMKDYLGIVSLHSLLERFLNVTLNNVRKASGTPCYEGPHKRIHNRTPADGV